MQLAQQILQHIPSGRQITGFHTLNVTRVAIFSDKQKIVRISYPHTIENCVGEKMIFTSVDRELSGDTVFLENFIAPDSGPLTYNHLLQDKSLTVISGRLVYQINDGPIQYASVGDTVLFKRGIPHRFWNDGPGTLKCKGWVRPADSIVFFLTAIYDAQNKSGKKQPERFDSAFLLSRYHKEHDLPEIPRFARKIIMPLRYYIGHLLGKYRHFRNAPQPVHKFVNYYL